jgi:hypothetical protein
LRIGLAAPIIKAMVGAVVFLVAGLSMMLFNGPLVRRVGARGRAHADRARIRWVKRYCLWQYDPGWEPFARVGLVVMGLLWTTAGVVIVVLTAVGVGRSG